jgi:type IV pilus assembly protein PilX
MSRGTLPMTRAGKRSTVRPVPPSLPSTPRRERGVVLFIALIVLVAMTLAGLALFRSVGTGVIIAGNLAFKQNATVGADGGIEAGRAWLTAQSAGTLDNDGAAGTGYYSSWQNTFNPATFNWNNNSSNLVGTDGAGNEIRYVVHRLCVTPNVSVNDPSQQCVSLTSAGAGGSKGGGSYGVAPLSNTIQAYFRITARAAGPKNTFSYVQSIMY